MSNRLDNTSSASASSTERTSDQDRAETTFDMDRERTTRRRLIQGAAAGAAAVGSLYVKPSFRSFGVPVALAASGLVCTPACDTYFHLDGTPCTDCYCKDSGGGVAACWDPTDGTWAF